MEHIPVAHPSPRPRKWTFPKRGLAIMLVFLGVLAMFGAALTTLWSGSTTVWAARADELRSNTPVHNSHGFYVVLLPSGEVIALVEKDSHDYPTSDVCPIEWRTDFVFESKTGWFRGECSGSTFSIDGSKAFGPSPRSMDRYAVEVKNGDVLVDTRRVLCPPGYPSTYCD